MDTPSHRALIVGHSFVRRTYHFAHSGLEGTSPDCHLKDLTINWHGRGGLSVHRLNAHLPALLALRPHLLVLDIGTNDLSPPGVCPVQLARLVYGAAHWLVASIPPLRFVFILDICKRAPSSCYPCRPDFNHAVYVFNHELRQQIMAHGGPVCCVPLKGLDDHLSYLSADGVHLTSRVPRGKTHSGVFHHFMAIRRALIKGVSLLASTCELPQFSPFFRL